MIARFLGVVFAWALRLLAASWRVSRIGFEQADSILAHDGVLAGFWHGQSLPLYPLIRVRGILIFTSESFRGAVIRAICTRFGFTARAIPACGGDAAIAFMRDAAAGHRIVGVALDGPLGPNHIVKRGSIRLASDLGLRFIPIGLWSHAHVAFHRWDRMEIPLPFSRVRLVAGPPVDIPPGVPDDEAVTLWREKIRAAMDDADRSARGETPSWNASLSHF